jgi:hypothetical protein
MEDPKSMKASLIAFALAVCAALPAPGQTPAADELSTLKVSYERAVEQAVTPLRTRYIDSLHSLKLKFSQAGDLDAALATDAEIKAAANDDGSAGATGKDLPPELSALKRGYQVSSARAGGPLTDKYVEALDALKLKYTQLGKLEMAVAVDQEIKKVHAERNKAIPKTITSEPIDAGKLVDTRWKLPSALFTENPDQSKRIRFRADGLLKCSWSQSNFTWKVSEEGPVELRPFRDKSHVLRFIWNGKSRSAELIGGDGARHKIERMD